GLLHPDREGAGSHPHRAQHRPLEREARSQVVRATPQGLRRQVASKPRAGERRGEGAGPQWRMHLSQEQAMSMAASAPIAKGCLPPCTLGCRRDTAIQICARPPSTASSLAVMKLLSGDARKAAAAPSSAGSAMRWSGFIEAKAFRPSSPTASLASSVAVGPGDSTLTRMPVPFRSSAQLFARLRTAALLAL